MFTVEAEKFFLQPGFIFASQEPYLIHTVLGSCVSVSLWDSIQGFGGMNHYIYGRAKPGQANGKYGDAAILHLIRLMRELGSRREDLRAHIIGGAQNPVLNSRIGEENARVAQEILAAKGIQVVSQDVGGNLGRKVIFNSGTGEVFVYKVQQVRESDWYS